MRQTFRGFYSDEDKIAEVLKSDGVRIIFDTNVLHKLYEYQEETQKEFFDLLEKLGDKVWIPYHVGLEFQRNRISKIKKLKAEFNEVTPLLNKVRSAFDTFKGKAELRKRIPALQKQTEEFEETLTQLIDSYAGALKEWEEKQPEVRSSDSVRVEIDKIFTGRVGGAPDQDWVDNANELGENRYKLRLPPGFEDDEKTDEFNYAGVRYKAKYGDWYLWKQSFEAVAKLEEITAVVFVTEDSKADWWYIVDSNGKKTIGADARLREEMCREGNVEYYFQYNILDFIEHASKAVNVKLDETSISDVKYHVSLNYDELADRFKASSYPNGICEADLKVNASWWPTRSEVAHHFFDDVSESHEKYLTGGRRALEALAELKDNGFFSLLTDSEEPDFRLLEECLLSELMKLYVLIKEPSHDERREAIFKAVKIYQTRKG